MLHRQQNQRREFALHREREPIVVGMSEFVFLTKRLVDSQLMLVAIARKLAVRLYWKLRKVPPLTCRHHSARMHPIGLGLSTRT